MAAPASEPAAGNPKFPLLDGLRGIAALSVLGYHWVAATGVGGIAGELLGHGNIGVVIFFLLSGFLIYRPFVVARTPAGRPVSVRSFYLRRAVRIIPAYWVALSLLALWPGLAAFGDRWWQLYLFGQVYSPRLVFSGGIGPAWSLCIEVSFYLLLPLYAFAVVRALRRSARPVALELGVLALLAVGSMGVHQLIARDAAIANSSFTLPGTFYLFAVGMALAVVSVHTNLVERASRYANAAWLCALALYVALALGVSAASLGSVNPLYVPTALLLLLPAAALPDGRRTIASVLLAYRPVALLGLVSYAFYLWHQTIVEQLHRQISQPVVLLFASIAVTLVVAALSYVIVERPALRTFARRRRPHLRRAREEIA
jgi:peptidoglycan/LPS O-acetylase OafA/YrhL